ncbi:MAG: molybdopterin-binding protein [Pseudomonadota bacterium]
MTFGDVPLAAAEGSILAHSVRVASGRLRKGRVLDASDIASLRAAGHETVIAATLGPDDVAENAAAAALAAALVPDPAAAGVSLTAPFTGRVNVLAGGPGVTLLDVAAIHAANAVHPMITIATVPPHQQMARQGMMATVKIISYAVPRAALEAACAAARDALRLAVPVRRSATLIVTEIDGGPGAKGQDAIAGRLTALGATLDDVISVPHRTNPLAGAIAEVRSDVALILTGSATSDPEDVAPAALRAAGGTVTRFGMPVDPGNLLFLGDLSGRPVIGLPGCARSPALNGADWVLSRVTCDVPVTDADIAGMGVGGLLKEIPTRPQPRRGRTGNPAAQEALSSD